MHYNGNTEQICYKGESNMKFKHLLPLLLAGLMTFSIIGLAGCDTGNSGNTGNTGDNTQQGDDKDPDNKDPDNKDPDDTPKEDKWNNEGIWLSKDAVVPTEAVTLPTSDGKRTTNVSVHDPSIFHDPAARGKYYAFGTHFAVASSSTLITWKQEASDNQWQVLYGEERSKKYANWPAALETTLDEVKPGGNITTTWAPDVEYYNGKYYMYYSITKAFGSDESAIGRVEADAPLGPYSNNRIIISSVGATGDHPNCIDSELFYDKDGKLWMTYGSFFGGVYVKELYNEGENWGLPKEDGWGTLIWRNGYQAGVEGPYVFYNATTDYYYLMVSEGDLNTVYNMRIARSKNPNGPYTDITGNDVATQNGKGNKVAGNYKFSADRGYAAMGHNSVIKDALGRYFVIYHARRQDGETGVTAPHNLTVSQLYFNEEGWPVMSPNAYVGEKFGTVTEAQVAGDYEIVLHTVATGTAENILWAQSENYTLSADKTVTKAGASVGTWTLKQGFYVEITIDSVTYKGVVAPGWDMYGNKQAGLSLTAISDEGRPLWAIPKV